MLCFVDSPHVSSQSQCKSSWDSTVNLPADLMDLPYAQELCQSMCIDDFVQSRCHCTVLRQFKLIIAVSSQGD